jgi:hypothetical protein
MPLALIVVALVPLLLAPVVSAELRDRALEWERRQIAADNAAIVLGREVRRALRALGSAEQAIAGFEVGHHAAHLCAAVKPTCRVADVAAERALLLAARTAEAAFRAAMTAAPLAALGELRRETVPLAAPQWRLTSERCPFCGLSVRWRLELGRGAVGTGAERRVVSWSGERRRADYRVRWDPAAAGSWSKSF